MEPDDKYALRGVSSGKEDVHKAIHALGPGLFPDAFCRILPDYLGTDDSCVILMHADGAGTKSALAYAWWKKTGDVSVWENLARDAVVMNTDDLLCAGATGPMVFSSSIGRNKKNIPCEVLAVLIESTQSFLEELSTFGIPCYLSGGETADVGDLVRTIVVDATVVARMKKQDVITTSGMEPGMVVVGLCSYGKATYEREYNGGMGSNGLTAARHDLFHSKMAEDFPETYDPSLEANLVYCGKYSMEHPVEVVYFNGKEQKKENIPLAKLVLSPTRTYIPVLLPFIEQHRRHIGAIIHCTGGGQTKVLHFLRKNLRIVKDNLFPPGPLFSLLKAQYPLHSSEPYRNFNMGHRMEVYLHEEPARELIDISSSYGVEAKIIGRVEKSECPELIISDDGNVFHFKK